MRTSGEELIALKVPDDGAAVINIVLQPGQSKMPIYDSFAKTFDRYRLESLSISFQPSVGITTAGLVCIGVDFDPRIWPKTLQAVMAYTPKVVGPVWQRKSMTVPQRQLMSRKLLYTYNANETSRPYEDGPPLVICVGHDMAKSSSLGYLQVKYTVYFEGPYAEN